MVSFRSVYCKLMLNFFSINARSPLVCKQTEKFIALFA
ncbi:hypothetical protein D1AOALGA4SA_7184 [Olavius algarvensis Delta 1 endosymbiont]|nr:hypothetical protein D1AOALGA4SA_7184 [Olavius algarvensis Delta 1 endosymbiont]